MQTLIDKPNMPRARKPKVGLMRIDAALDALRPMGFPESLVRRTVRNLLKAYGGDEGWTFIEEFSYKLLIDSVLEELEGENNGSTLLEDRLSKDNIKEDMRGKQVHPSESDRHSKQVELSSSQSLLLQKQAIQGDFPSNNSSPSPSVSCSLKSENSQVKLKISGVSSSELCSPPAVESKQIQSSSSQSPPPLKKLAARVDSPGNNSSTLMKAVPCSSKSVTSQFKLEEQLPSPKISPGLSSRQLFSPPALESRSARRRKPYYGWISSDDEEEPDLVYAGPPTSLPPCSY